MMFIVALYLPWCLGLADMAGVFPQLYADNLKCVSHGEAELLAAAQFYQYVHSSGWAGGCS